jgi:hypothetical protein
VKVPRCRICRAVYEPAACRVEGDRLCCDQCRVTLARISAARTNSSALAVAGVEDRIARRRARAEAGLPLFDPREREEVPT